MKRVHESEILYFSTTVELKINGVSYRPSICYKVPPLAKKSLEAFVKAGKVKFHKEPIRFVNGEISHKPKAQPVKEAASFVDEQPPKKKGK